MPLLPLPHSLHGATSTAASTLVLSGILSGAALAALFNALIGYLKDRSAFRRQKLEEIHQAVFAMTWGIQPALLALGMELNHRQTLLDQQRGYTLVSQEGIKPGTIQMAVSQEGSSQEKLDACNERIRQLRKDFPKERLLSALEVFVRLSSVYFLEIIDERDPVTDQVMEVVRTHSFAPEHQVITNWGNEVAANQKLVWNGEKIRLRLFKKIWNLSEPRVPLSRGFWRHHPSVPVKVTHPVSTPTGSSHPPAGT